MKNLLTLRHIVEFCLFLGTVAGADTDTKTVPTVAGEDSDAKTLPTVEDKDPDTKTVPTRTNLKSVFNSCSLTFLYETIRKQGTYTPRTTVLTCFAEFYRISITYFSCPSGILTKYGTDRQRRYLPKDSIQPFFLCQQLRANQHWRGVHGKWKLGHV